MAGHVVSPFEQPMQIATMVPGQGGRFQSVFPLTKRDFNNGIRLVHQESAGKESTCSAGDLGSISGLRRSPGEGNG